MSWNELFEKRLWIITLLKSTDPLKWTTQKSNYTTAIMTAPITRVTMIKLPSQDHHTIALKGFKTFTETQQKVHPPLPTLSPSSLMHSN
jgi:hypothetical protein